MKIFRNNVEVKVPDSVKTLRDLARYASVVTCGNFRHAYAFLRSQGSYTASSPNNGFMRFER